MKSSANIPALRVPDEKAISLGSGGVYLID